MLPPALSLGIREAGCDEAGRGCLAGPVYAAAVILPDDFSHPWLTDSKQLTERRREELRPLIMEQAVAWGIGVVSAREIDEINILQASILAMHRALDAMGIIPGGIVVDGNKFRTWREDVPWQTIVKGDGKLANIAAASILAKTARDEDMRRLHTLLPVYGWDVNKGYPTKAHRAAIAAHGPSEHHRMTFRLQ